MQVKKEEVIEAIMASATREFYNHGFEKASLRTIAKNAGTTIGNFYNYFPNKEALFSSIVDQPYKLLITITKNHDAIERNNEIWQVQDVGVWRKELVKLIHNFLPMITKSLIILIDGSKGTQYAHAKETFKTLMADHFLEHIEEFQPAYKNPELASIFADQLINGSIDIIKNHKDTDVQERLIIDYLLFFAIGTMGLLS